MIDKFLSTSTTCHQQHYQGLMPVNGIDLKLCLSLVGLYVSLFFIFVPGFPLERNNSGSKILKMGGWHRASTGGHVYLLWVASSGSIPPLLGILANAILIESWEHLIIQVSGMF